MNLPPALNLEILPCIYVLIPLSQMSINWQGGHRGSPLRSLSSESLWVASWTIALDAAPLDPLWIQLPQNHVQPLSEHSGGPEARPFPSNMGLL